MDREKLTQRLTGIFLGELEEHVQALDANLLAFEKRPGASERLEVLAELFRAAHSLKGAAGSVNVKLIELACHHLEEILSRARRSGGLLPPLLVQLLFETSDAIRDAGARLRKGDRLLEGSPLGRLLPRLEAAVEGEGLQGGNAEPPARDRSVDREIAAELPVRRGESGVSIPPERLDRLLARGDELLIARHRSAGHAGEVALIREKMHRLNRERRRRSEAALDAEAVEMLIEIERDLEALSTQIASAQHFLEQVAAPFDHELRALRMTRFSRAVEGLDRAARDIARDSQKEVDVVIAGSEVEIDRAVAEALRSPLLHLVRNAVAHGIETPDERLRAGKSRVGRIAIGAALRGARVQLSVSDDGAGIDVTAVREQARSRGIALPAGDREVAQMVFIAGLSTAPAVTGASGRGVGLDIVKSRIEAIGGSIEFTSEAGKGTEFRLSVPLTLTTIPVVLARAGGETFAIDTASIHTLARIRRDEVQAMEGRDVISMDGEIVPLASLASVIGLEEPPVAKNPLDPDFVNVVAIDAEHRVAFSVDALLAAQDVLVKSLGKRMLRIRNISGATLLPDGAVALIINGPELVRSAMQLPSHTRFVPAPAAEKVKRKVMVVDDSVTTRALVRSILEASGYDVVVASDGAEAWRLLPESGAELVVSDVEMPRMDGFTLTETIRASPRFRGLPVVLVTALETDVGKARGMAVGADAYLLKSSFDQTRLLETITQLL